MRNTISDDNMLVSVAMKLLNVSGRQIDDFIRDGKIKVVGYGAYKSRLLSRNDVEQIIVERGEYTSSKQLNKIKTLLEQIESSECISCSEAARLLGVTRQRIYQIIEEGKLDTYGVGKRRIPISSIENYLNAKLYKSTEVRMERLHGIGFDVAQTKIENELRKQSIREKGRAIKSHISDYIKLETSYIKRSAEHFGDNTEIIWAKTHDTYIKKLDELSDNKRSQLLASILIEFIESDKTISNCTETDGRFIVWTRLTNEHIYKLDRIALDNNIDTGSLISCIVERYINEKQ